MPRITLLSISKSFRDTTCMRINVKLSNFLSPAFFAVVLISVVVSCTKPRNIKWVYYDQTLCADKWGPYTSNEDLKIKITDYFDGIGIEVYDIEIFNFGTPETCLACTCKTGKTIKLKIKKKHLDDIKKEGFYE